MPIAHSKLTTQGQISVPAEVRKILGIGPGSVLEWHDNEGVLVVRRAGRFSSADIHQSLFPNGAPTRISTSDVKLKIKEYMRKRYAGG